MKILTLDFIRLIKINNTLILAWGLTAMLSADVARASDNRARSHISQAPTPASVPKANRSIHHSQIGYLSRLDESFPVSIGTAANNAQSDPAMPLSVTPKGGSLTAATNVPPTNAPAPAQLTGSGVEISLSWPLTEASFGFAPGYAGLQMIDIVGDSRPEVVVVARGAASYWYVAAWTGNQLRKIYVSPGYPSDHSVNDDGIVDLKVFRTNDGSPRVALATKTELHIYDLRNYALLQRLPLPGMPRRIAIGDIDADGDQDCVALLGGNYYYYPFGNGTFVALDLDTSVQLWSFLATGQVYEFSLGDFTSDPGLEIVGAGTPGYLLAGATGDVLWQRPGGFGVDVAAGNFDADPDLEFAAMDSGSTFTVYDGALHQALWARTGLSDLEHIDAHDFNDDGRDEILMGDGQWGFVRVYSSLTQQVLDTIQNSEHGVGRMAAGDVDGDGVDEIVFGSGLTSSGTDQLTVVRFGGGLRWSANDEAGPHPDVRVADLDSDGDNEVVWATMTSNSGYRSGNLRALDAQTFDEQWVAPIFSNVDELHGIRGLDVGQLDRDPQLEIVEATSNSGGTVLQIRDGMTGLLERAVPLLPDGAPAHLPRIVSRDTLLMAYNGRLRTIDLATGIVSWTSDLLPGGPAITLTVANSDDDSQLEALATTGTSVVIYDLMTRAIQWQLQLPAAVSVLDVANHRLYVGSDTAVRAYDTRTQARVATYTVGGAVDALFTANSASHTLLFAVRTDGVLEGFDTATGQRIFSEATERPGFAQRASIVASAPTGDGVSVWAASAFGVHRADFSVHDTFADGFE